MNQKKSSIEDEDVALRDPRSKRDWELSSYRLTRTKKHQIQVEELDPSSWQKTRGWGRTFLLLKRSENSTIAEWSCDFWKLLERAEAAKRAAPGTNYLLTWWLNLQNVNLPIIYRNVTLRKRSNKINYKELHSLGKM